MKDKFPYPGKPAVVTKEMCDMNGHMNVVHYYHIFSEYTNLYHDMGFSHDYFVKGFSSFTLETNLSYLKEIKEGEECYPHYRIINVSPKLIHYGGILLTEECGGVFFGFCVGRGMCVGIGLWVVWRGLCVVGCM